MSGKVGMVGMLLCLAGIHNRKPKTIVIWETSYITAILEPDVCTRCGSMRRGDRQTLLECQGMVKKETEQ